jgi:hypothetical protein
MANSWRGGFDVNGFNLVFCVCGYILDVCCEMNNMFLVRLCFIDNFSSFCCPEGM